VIVWVLLGKFKFSILTLTKFVSKNELHHYYFLHYSCHTLV